MEICTECNEKIDGMAWWARTKADKFLVFCSQEHLCDYIERNDLQVEVRIAGQTKTLAEMLA